MFTIIMVGNRRKNSKVNLLQCNHVEFLARRDDKKLVVKIFSYYKIKPRINK